MNWTNQKPNCQHYIELIEIAIGYAQRNVNFPKIYGKNLKLCKYHELILTKNGYRFPFNYSNFQLIKKHRSTKSLSFFSAQMICSISYSSIISSDECGDVDNFTENLIICAQYVLLIVKMSPRFGCCSPMWNTFESHSKLWRQRRKLMEMNLSEFFFSFATSLYLRPICAYNVSRRGFFFRRKFSH